MRIANEPIREMEPKDIFRRLAQLQPHNKFIWLRSFKYWRNKKAAASPATSV